jgi:hypothetical protein
MKKLSIKTLLLFILISNYGYAQNNIFPKNVEDIEKDLNEIYFKFQQDSNLVLNGMGESFCIIIESDTLGRILNITLDLNETNKFIFPKYLTDSYIQYFMGFKFIKNIFFDVTINEFDILIRFLNTGADIFICPSERVEFNNQDSKICPD